MAASRRQDGEAGAAKAPLITFIALLVTGSVWLALVPGRAAWAASDDWRMVGTHAWTLTGLLTDHNQHFSLVPILLYKSLFAAFGFHPFWPYVAITILLHACVVVTVRMIMVRSGATPWIATICASSLIFVQGGSVVVSQFQMSLGLALALTAFILAMNRSAAWTLVIAAVCAVGAVASSGISLPIIAAAFIVAWRRQGLVRAIAIAAPAGVVYAAWWLTYRPDMQVTLRPPAGQWLPPAAWNVVMGLGGLRISALVLLGATIAGVTIALVVRRTGLRWLEPGVLAVAALIMLVLVYAGRGYSPPTGIGFARFVYLAAAQVLPLVAVAATVLARRSAWLLLLVAGPLTVGAAVNVVGWQDEATTMKQVSDAGKASLAGLLTSPAGPTTPDWVRPYETTPYFVAGDTPWGFLREVSPDKAGVDTGAVSTEAANAAVLRLRLARTKPQSPPVARCVTGTEPVRRQFEPGERVLVPSLLTPNPPVTMALVEQGRTQPGTVLVAPGLEGATLEVVGPPPGLTVQFESAEAGTEFTVCF